MLHVDARLHRLRGGQAVVDLRGGILDRFIRLREPRLSLRIFQSLGQPSEPLLLGGLKYSEQAFNARVAGMHTVSLVLAVVALIMPALFHSAAPNAPVHAGEAVSVGVASILILIYLCSLLFSFKTHRDVLGIPNPRNTGRTRGN